MKFFFWKWTLVCLFLPFHLLGSILGPFIGAFQDGSEFQIKRIRRISKKLQREAEGK